LQWADVGKWLSMHFKLPVKKVPLMLEQLTREQAEVFVNELADRVKMK
jgi:hypothetical protein